MSVHQEDKLMSGQMFPRNAWLAKVVDNKGFDFSTLILVHTFRLSHSFLSPLHFTPFIFYFTSKPHVFMHFYLAFNNLYSFCWFIVASGTSFGLLVVWEQYVGLPVEPAP